MEWKNSSGDRFGNEAELYKIESAEQLAKISELILNGAEDFSVNYIILTANSDGALSILRV